MEKKNLQRELLSKIKYVQNFFYGKFANSGINETFNRLFGCELKNIQLFCGIFNLFLFLFMILDHIWNAQINSYNNDLVFIIIGVILIFLNILFMIIIYVTDGNSTLNHVSTILKFASLIIYTYYCLILIAVY